MAKVYFSTFSRCSGSPECRACFTFIHSNYSGVVNRHIQRWICNTISRMNLVDRGISIAVVLRVMGSTRSCVGLWRCDYATYKTEFVTASAEWTWLNGVSQSLFCWGSSVRFSLSLAHGDDCCTKVFGEYNLNCTHCQMLDETTFKFQVALSISKLWLDKVTATIVALRFLRGPILGKTNVKTNLVYNTQ